MNNFINFFLFQIGWWSCVGFAAGFLNAVQLTLLLALILGIHFKKCVVRGSQEILFITAIFVCGYFMDFTLSFFSIVSFYGPGLSNIPFWLMGMWLLFPMLIGHSLSWLKGRILLQALLGGVGGALTYYAGTSFKIIHFDSVIDLGVLGLAWALFFPACYFIHQFIFRRRPENKILST